MGRGPYIVVADWQVQTAEGEGQVQRVDRYMPDTERRWWW